MDVFAFILIFSADFNDQAFAGSAPFYDLEACEAAAEAIFPDGHRSDGQIDSGNDFAICVPAASGS